MSLYLFQIELSTRIDGARIAVRREGELHLTGIARLHHIAPDIRTGTSTGGSHLCDVQYLLAHILTYEGEGARRIVLGHRTRIDKRMLKLQQFLLRIHRNRQSQEEKRQESKYLHITSNYIQPLLPALFLTVTTTVWLVPPAAVTVSDVLPAASPFTMSVLPSTEAEATLPFATEQENPSV